MVGDNYSNFFSFPMTYCFAFSANPDGISVISDTRISTESKFMGSVQKVFFPTENSFVAVSGTIGILKTLLEGVSEILSTTAPAKCIDILRNHLTIRYSEMFVQGCVTAETVHDHALSIIYGDVKYEKGGTRSRLARFEFSQRDSKPAVGWQVAPRFGWLAIGGTPSLRRFLSLTAAHALEDIESRGLVVTRESITQNPYSHLQPYMTVDDRSRSHALKRKGLYKLDSSGPRDGSFRKKLRCLANEQQIGGGIDLSLEPIRVFGMTALKAIAEQVATFKTQPTPDIQAISDIWCMATISRRHGVKLHTFNDLEGVTIDFKVKPAFS